jgi:tetratricopeptide (TPR) repeat protein
MMRGHWMRMSGGVAATVMLAMAAIAAPEGGSGAVAWRDMRGATHAAADGDSRATVLLFGSTRCPCADGYTSRVRQLAAEYAPRGVRFFAVFSGAAVPRAEVAAYTESRRLAFPAVHDTSERLARQYGAKVTPTAVLLTEGAVRYHGRIDDSPEPVAVRRQYLREALDAVLAGRRVALAQTAPVGCAVGAQKGEKPTGPPKLVEGIGTVRFPITTTKGEAQRYFAQGMARWYGFNMPEAERSFREVVRLDPECAMGWWGITLSLGMDYNEGYDPERLPEARAAIRKALSLARYATAKEQALIRAMAVRNDTDDQKKALAPYRAAMARVHRSYPQDDNIAVLYAASIMDLRPWALWTKDRKPLPDTAEALRVLEATLRRDPNHIGANHYYIHATEGTGTPEKALPSARRLAALAPNSGHLVHMPAHTYMRVGDYANSSASNELASQVDRLYFAAEGKPTRYAPYYLHNLDFLIAADMMGGRVKPAVEAARQLAEVAAQLTPADAPLWCGSASGIIAVYARCRQWDDILKAAAPPEANPFATAMWRYARGMAYAAKRDRASAERELAALRTEAVAAEKAVPVVPIPGFTESFQKTYRLLVPVLSGKVALLSSDGEAALAHFRQGVEIEDTLPYLEPATWRYPVREALGGALLTLNRPKEAEAVFRADLQRNPNSGRSLFGLMTALERQGRRDEASRVRAQFQEAWKRADIQLRAEEL